MGGLAELLLPHPRHLSQGKLRLRQIAREQAFLRTVNAAGTVGSQKGVLHIHGYS